MDKLSKKDFKHCDKQVEIVSCDTKSIFAVLVLTENKIVYNIVQTNSNIIMCAKTLDEAIEEYNRLP